VECSDPAGRIVLQITQHARMRHLKGRPVRPPFSGGFTTRNRIVAKRSAIMGVMHSDFLPGRTVSSASVNRIRIPGHFLFLSGFLLFLLMNSW